MSERHPCKKKKIIGGGVRKKKKEKIKKVMKGIDWVMV